MLAIKNIAAILVQRPLRIVAVAVSAAALTGCFDMRGVHYVNHKGDSDAGAYSITMETPLYIAMMADKPATFDSLKRYSRPRATHRDGRTTIADDSGGATMERAYDRFDCKPSPGLSGWSDCSYSYSNSGLTFPAWSLDWSVVLHPEMVVLRSNHERRTVRNGVQVLQWYFDGNRVNSFDIDFTVRVPNSR